MGEVIFVTGFKGGVGKTTVSANIASTLHALGYKVCVVDGDFGMRCMDMVLGLESETLFDCSDILGGRCSATAAITEVRGDSGFAFIPAPINHVGEKYSKAAYSNLFSELKEEFDYIILDSCAEMTDYYISFASQADRAIVVSLHQSTSVRAAEKTATRLSAMGVKDLALVVNGYRENMALKGKLPTIAEIINRSSVRLLGVVPYSERLQALQEAAELAFTGNMRKKTSLCEGAFYNLALRICGKRIPLFDGLDKLRRRSAYDGIIKTKKK